MFLDANIFIHSREVSDPRGRSCRSLLDQIAAGTQRATTSWLVVNEVVNFYIRTNHLDAALRCLEMIRGLPNLDILPLDSRTGTHVAYYLHSGLLTSDAFHAATMKAHQIQVLCSFDKGFDKVDGIRRMEPK